MTPRTPKTIAEILDSPRVALIGAVVAGGLLLAGWGLRSLASVEQGAILIWVSLGIGMVFGMKAAIDSLKERSFDIDVLMVLGAGLAAWQGAPAEGSLLLFLFTISGALEGLAVERTQRAVTSLHALMPTAALRADGKGGYESVSPEALIAGDRIKVITGESAPADARVVVGESSFDQATLTGESVPRDVRVGDEIFAGTINVGDAVEAEVLRPASESSLRRILQLVLTAQEQREPVQRVIDRFSERYAIGVVVVSALVFLVWWGLLGFTLAEATTTAVTLLIVMSPCAVIIATPTATLAAISRGARAGVLFKGGQSIERLARIGALALDKTGTLTRGRPSLESIQALDGADPKKLLAIAAALESESTHPMAAAIREGAARLAAPAVVLEGRTRFTHGGGMAGEFDGCEARLGNYAFAEPLLRDGHAAQVREALGKAHDEALMAVALAWNGSAATIVMHDELRDGALDLVARLHELGVTPVVMLTGDHDRAARRIAEKLGIDRWRAQCLPQDKVDELAAIRKELGAAGRPAHRRGVGLLGDGVNDAPALAAADVSIAIGSIGSDAALESADIVLLGESISAAPWAIGLARRARRTIIANLSMALIAIVFMSLLTLVGPWIGVKLALWMGVLGHEGGTLVVVVNSLLLLAYGDGKRARQG